MSIFVTSKALEAENRKFKRSSKVMTRTRLPSQLKTKKCSLEEYHNKCKPGLYQVQDFILCEDHFQIWKRKTENYKTNYTKANSL